MNRREALVATASAFLLPAMTRAPDSIVSVDRGDKGRLFDANGSEVRKCVWANLRTGECVVFQRDSQGNVVVANNSVMKVMIRCPAPLTFIPLKVANC